VRDPRRIWRIIHRLGTLWERYPDQRLGQLLTNVAPSNADVYQIEDDVWEKMIEEAIDKGLGAR
jgi:hypothetical protein